VIYPGVSETFFIAPPEADVMTTRQRYGPRYALFVGESDWRKRPEHALAAIASTDARLLIVGPNERHAARIHRLAARAGVTGRVTLAGYVSDRDLVAAYAGASVLLFPSRYEGFGLPLLEAAAVGVPAVAYANSSIPEAAGEGTRLIPDGDEVRFVGEARAIVNGTGTLPDPQAARARARQFSWDRTADQMLRAFRELA
jgi:glycosyltransferase involved in cell wall biosynthesis